MATNTAERFTPGDIFAGRYRMIELIGRGGMGDVWRADDLVLQTPVALKVLRAGVKGRREQVVNEVRLARQITHPAVCRVFDVGDVDGELFLSMELVQGEDLAALLKRAGRLPPEKVIDIAHQLCGGLAAAHRRGVLHRDLKPANVLIDERGSVRITDFGIAIPSAGPAQGGVAGTPLYMAPEQMMRGGACTEQTDLYALGIVLYELLTGRHPYAPPDTIAQPGSRAVPDAGDRAAPVPPSQLVDGVDRRLEAAIMSALAPVARRRPASAQAMRDSLPAASDHIAVAHRPLVARIRARAHPRLAAIGIAVVVVVLTVVSGRLGSRSPRSLTDQDTIIIADVANTTGDRVFDGTLKQALAVALEQSPFLRILPDERIEATLRLMGRREDAPVTSDLAREVAQREGLVALVAGSISSLGRNYVIQLEAVNAQTGAVMAREQVEARGKEQVLGALGSATARLRERLGESLPSIERFNAPLERATTSSLEALKAYSTAMEHLRSAPSLEAVPFLTRALELDPEFALAYAQLSRVYTNTRQPALAPPLSEKAFALRDRVSERERFQIAWRYYRDATQSWEEALGVARAWTEAYPREATAFNSLGLAHLELGRHDDAVEALTQATQLDPRLVPPYLNLGSILTTLGKYDEAKVPLQRAAEHGSEGSTLGRYLYSLAFVRNDVGAMERLEVEAGRTLEDYAAFQWRGRRQGYSGKTRAAHLTYREGVSLARAKGLDGPAAQLQTEDAEIHAIAGQCDDARTEARSGLAFSRDNFTLERASRVLAWCGALDEASALSRELARRFPDATHTRLRWLPITAAASAVIRRSPTNAIARLDRMGDLEAGAQLWPAYLRGSAFLQLRQGSAAREQFQFVLDHRGHYLFSPLHPLAHLGLARALRLEGETLRATQAYDQFLALWNDADPDIAHVVEARRERASLE